MASDKPVRWAPGVQTQPPRKTALQNACVLLTGATGFIGSLVLEQMLRTYPDVARVHVTIRAKRGEDPQKRLNKLLEESPVFDLLRQGRSWGELHPKVSAVHADISLPMCGLTADAQAQLKRQVTHVIHCAASLSLHLHIHEALQQTYFPTKGLLQLAEGMPNMRAFCFVSTAYVNANLPKGSTVEEKVYPLHDHGVPVDHATMVQHLMSLNLTAAEAESTRLLQHFGYLNTYLLSKTLTERMVLEHHQAPFPVCIVRPALCGAVAGLPCPGYIGNTSGATAAILAVATGIATFTGYRPESRLPLVPGDVVAALVLAATAATADQSQGTQQVYHACSSAENPITLQVFYQHIVAYFSKSPWLGKKVHKRQFAWVSDKQFARRAAVKDVYYRVTCYGLRLSGQKRLAQKLMLGWKTWKDVGSSSMDHNLLFLCDGAKKLSEGRLSLHHPDLCRPTEHVVAGQQQFCRQQHSKPWDGAAAGTCGHSRHSRQCDCTCDLIGALGS
ncbi:Fatty acyl-CoA reductase 2 [Trebouxia sp. C0009 RCD-2024]